MVSRFNLIMYVSRMIRLSLYDRPINHRNGARHRIKHWSEKGEAKNDVLLVYFIGDERY